MTVITIKLDAGYAQKVSILGTWVNIKYQQCHLCIKVLEKDFSSPGKVLEKSLNFILENLYEPCLLHAKHFLPTGISHLLNVPFFLYIDRP